MNIYPLNDPHFISNAELRHLRRHLSEALQQEIHLKYGNVGTAPDEIMERVRGLRMQIEFSDWASQKVIQMEHKINEIKKTTNNPEVLKQRLHDPMEQLSHFKTNALIVLTELHAEKLPLQEQQEALKANIEKQKIKVSICRDDSERSNISIGSIDSYKLAAEQRVFEGMLKVHELTHTINTFKMQIHVISRQPSLLIHQKEELEKAKMELAKFEKEKLTLATSLHRLRRFSNSENAREDKDIALALQRKITLQQEESKLRNMETELAAIMHANQSLVTAALDGRAPQVIPCLNLLLETESKKTTGAPHPHKPVEMLIKHVNKAEHHVSFTANLQANDGIKLPGIQAHKRIHEARHGVRTVTENSELPPINTTSTPIHGPGGMSH